MVVLSRSDQSVTHTRAEHPLPMPVDPPSYSSPAPLLLSLVVLLSCRVVSRLECGTRTRPAQHHARVTLYLIAMSLSTVAPESRDTSIAKRSTIPIRTGVSSGGVSVYALMGVSAWCCVCVWVCVQVCVCVCVGGG